MGGVRRRDQLLEQQLGSGLILDHEVNEMLGAASGLATAGGGVSDMKILSIFHAWRTPLSRRSDGAKVTRQH
jgi:hypothetical protein